MLFYIYQYSSKYNAAVSAIDEVVKSGLSIRVYENGFSCDINDVSEEADSSDVSDCSYLSTSLI